MLMLKALTIAVLSFAAFGQRQPSAPSGTTSSETRAWAGALVDATRTNCGPEVERAAAQGGCPVSMRTTNFALTLPDGKLVKFDEGGNTKTVDALRKSRKASKIVFNYWKTGKMSAAVKARVTGTLTGDTLNVETINID